MLIVFLFSTLPKWSNSAQNVICLFSSRTQWFIQHKLLICENSPIGFQTVRLNKNISFARVNRLERCNSRARRQYLTCVGIFPEKKRKKPRLAFLQLQQSSKKRHLVVLFRIISMTTGAGAVLACHHSNWSGRLFSSGIAYQPEVLHC